ncbi:beta strand repeat-containing protein, partial [Paraburkholderia caledonica]|uniref:beta strand repeat-containing protein n=1 Tax=Paraburkholderia caledonica TaxID=134536 RepID=UPI00037CB219
MNKNRFRRVFSKRLGMLVAVAENVASQGKQAGESAGVGPSGRELGVVSTMTAMAVALVAFQPSVSRAQSLPTNGQVMAGQASISQNTNTMTVNQGTQRTVIDWNSFNVGTGNTVQFNQPNAQAQALNRVTGGGASNIQGSLLANGQVLIQNANGVLFSKGSVVNVGSLLATTKSVDSNAFMAGGPLSLKSTGTNGSVVNDGAINAQGYVVLMGDQVRNSGAITTAQGGQVALAAGDSAMVALPNGQGIQLTLTNASANALVENSGNIKAENGTVLLTARGSNTLLNTVVNLSGVVRAGTVVADAGNTGDVAVTGKIDASNAAGQGGTVVLSGDRVGVFGNASIDASGATQGGKVIVGGDSLHKLDGTQAAAMLQDGVQFANFTQVDAGAKIDAGSAHGNGGFVETSGHSLDVQGQVSAAAPEGKAGEWLIDPTDVNITTAANANEAVAGGTFTPSTNTAKVNNGAINSALNGGTDVTITTLSSGTATGNIVQESGADITKSAGGNATLTLIANGSISLQGAISSTSGKLSLNATADAGHLGNGTVHDNANASYDLNGGSLTISGNSTAGNGLAGANAVYLQGNWTNVSGGSITGAANAGAGVTFAKDFTATGSNTLTVTGTSNAGTGVSLTPGASLTKTGSGLMSITGSSTAGYGVSIGRPGMSTASSVSVTDNGTLAITGVSNSGLGVYVSGNAVADKSSTLNISGTSQTGPGVGIDSTAIASGYTFSAKIKSSDNATVNIQASSNTGVGFVDYDGALLASQNATINLDANSNTSWGAQGAWQSTATDTAHINMNGHGTSGLWYQGAATASGDGVINMTGTGTAGHGVIMPNTTTTDNGTVNVVGTGTQDGVWERYGANVSGNSAVNVMGTSDSGPGVTITAPNSVSGNGTLTINGDSNTGTGVSDSSSLNVSGNGAAIISGNSNSGDATVINGSVNVAADGAVNISGQSTNGSGVIVNPNGSINISGNGAADIGGSSTNGNGAVIDGSLNVTDNGTLNVSGDSANGSGVIVDPNGSINISGNGAADINGTSTNGNGAVIDGSVNVTDNGTANISGNSTNGSGVIVDPNGSINISGNGAAD